MTSPRAFRQPGLGPPSQSASVNAPSRSADRLTPFHIRPRHTADPHSPPSRQFQALFEFLLLIYYGVEGCHKMYLAQLSYPNQTLVVCPSNESAQKGVTRHVLLDYSTCIISDNAQV
uniref:Uncharacterized protein n=1 Tax=Cajanus cajan TaxID=3821 RepID=A0A151QSJ3_CAJCA|nr:hypothetical protein KK1_045938 [Cajanus cajan]